MSLLYICCMRNVNLPKKTEKNSNITFDSFSAMKHDENNISCTLPLQSVQGVEIKFAWIGNSKVFTSNLIFPDYFAKFFCWNVTLKKIEFRTFFSSLSFFRTAWIATSMYTICIEHSIPHSINCIHRNA